jgi:hypothetical protein
VATASAERGAGQIQWQATRGITGIKFRASCRLSRGRAPTSETATIARETLSSCITTCTTRLAEIWLHFQRQGGTRYSGECTPGIALTCAVHVLACGCLCRRHHHMHQAAPRQCGPPAPKHPKGLSLNTAAAVASAAINVSLQAAPRQR